MLHRKQQKLAEAPTATTSGDSVGALVTMGELGRYKEVHEIVFPEFDTEYAEACVIEGEEVLTLRPEERGTQKLFVNPNKRPEEKWAPLLMDEDWVVLYQALY